MQKAVEERNRGRLHWQEVAPLLEWPMAGHAEAAAFVSGGHETKEQLGTSVIERSKPQLVDQDQLMAQEVADDLADGVVGQAAVQGFDQISGDQVADLHAAFHGAHAEIGRASCRERVERTGGGVGWIEKRGEMMR